MVRSRNFLLIFLAFAFPAQAQPQALGVFGQWGAFRDAARCYAISEAGGPHRRDSGPAFASIATWPRRNIRGQLHLRFARPKRAGSAVLLRIDGRTFQLIGGGADGWAPDAAADAAIVAAMRTGVEMSVETRSEGGGLLRDFYPLRGAATAIDAAAIACAR
ncbi:MAG: hypothetical protein QOH81_1317 [Sphingomonadales bacterium]|jgi:hypothetical protein|nr:hypothetical protein [Sphingomonadales bacterium]